MTVSLRLINWGIKMYMHCWREVSRRWDTQQTRRSANVWLMLDHRLRRWPNIKPTLAQRFVFAGYAGCVMWQIGKKHHEKDWSANNHDKVHEIIKHVEQIMTELWSNCFVILQLHIYLFKYTKANRTWFQFPWVYVHTIHVNVESMGHFVIDHTRENKLWLFGNATIYIFHANVRLTTTILESVHQIITLTQPFRAWIYHCHLHPLQAANCCRNSRLVVDEDDLMWFKNWRKLPCIGKPFSWKFSF